MRRNDLRALRLIINDFKKMSAKAADVRSFVRFVTDVLLCRSSRRLGMTRQDAHRVRQIRLRGGIRLFYRVNMGDLQSIREVWLDEVYRLPLVVEPRVLVDLGANIGMTSLWLCKKYGFTTVVAVEPSPGNAKLAKMNLVCNGISVDVLEAAVGPTDGTAFFHDDAASNMGHLSGSGRPVAVLSMCSVLRTLPADVVVNLIKMDIEGGEESLLNGNIEWLSKVQALIAEFHPEVIDYQACVRLLQEAGFDYIAAGSMHKDSMDSFVKQDRL